MAKTKNILVCPLDWGLGHATRCIPIIQELIANNYNVIIGANNEPLSLLRQEFPTLDWVKIPGYKVTYSSGAFMAGALLKVMPTFLKNNRNEKKILKKIIKEKKIHAVISDNRYGLWNKRIPSILITHQLRVITPSGLKWTTKIVNKYLRRLTNNFSYCWIPDTAGQINLSGKLSHFNPFPSNAKYIGPISRLKKIANNNNSNNGNYKLMGIASGPEPQRSIFERILTQQFLADGRKSIILRGLPNSTEKQYQQENITFFNHLPIEEMAKNILQSEIVICRSGYSTIMDLVLLKKNKNVILVPTPGQTEQEYLAGRMKSAGYFYYMPQNYFSLKRACERIASYKCIDFPDGHDLFDRAMLEFFKKI